MNVLHITANPQEGAIIRQEIANVAPDIHLEAAHGLQDVGALPKSFGTYDAILVDINLPNLETESVLTRIRQSGQLVPVIAMISPTDEDPPLKFLRAGVNDYVVKSGAYFGHLAARLRAAVAQREWVRQMPVLTPAEARLRLIIEAVPAAVVRLNGDGTILALNRHGLALIGAAQVEEIVTRNLLDLLPPTQQESVRLFLDDVCAGKRASAQFDWDALDRKMRRFELYGVPIQGGGEGVINVLGVLADITQASQMQHDLAETKERLERLQGELRQADAPTQEMAATFQMERGQWQAERLKLEQQAKEAQDQADRLQEMLRLSESDRGELEEKYTAEQAHIEELSKGFELRLKTCDAEISQLEQALHTSDSRQSETDEKNAQERMQWESTRQELEFQLKNSSDQIAELQQHVQAAENQSAELLELSFQSQNQRAELEKTLERQIQRFQSLEERQAALDGEHEEQYARLKGSYSELQQQLGVVQSQRASIESSLQIALEQQDNLSALRNADDEAERALLEQALHASDSHRSEMAEKHAQEQAQWMSAKQEFELQLKNTAEQNVELQQQIQAAAKQIAELFELSFQDRSQKDELQKTLEQQIQRAQLTEERQVELDRDHEEQSARLNTSYRELQLQLEAVQSQRASLESSLQTALDQREKLADEKKADEVERALLEQAFQASDAHRSEMGERYAQEQAQWASARQEFELQLEHSAEQIAELQQQIQAAEKQIAELFEQSSEDRSQRERLQKDLEQQIQRAQLLEERQAEPDREREEQHARLEASCRELQHQLEGAQSERAALESSLQSALDQRDKFADEKKADEAERALLEQAFQASDSHRSQMADKYAQEQRQWESARQEFELQLEQSADQVAELQQQIQVAEKQIAELFEQSSQDRGRRDELQKDLEQQVQRAQLMEERQAELDREHEEQYARLEASCRELQHQLEAVQSQRASLEISLKTAFEQQENLAAIRNADEAERALLEQALQASDSRCSEMAEKHAQEQIELESATQELELQLKNSADQIAGLQQQIQVVERKGAELIEQCSQDRNQRDRLQKDLEQQIQHARSLEERQAELDREHEEQYAQLKTSYGELQDRLEAIQSQRAAIEATLRAAFEQREKLAAENSATEAERARLEQALHLSDSRQSKLAEKYAQEQVRWEAARQELELQLKNGADGNAELRQQLQAAEKQIAELLEQGSQHRQQIDELQTNLEQQTRLAQVMEERRIANGREHEERCAQLKTTCDGLQQQAEDLRSQRDSLETSLQATIERHEKLATEKTAAEAAWDDELQLLKSQIQTLDADLEQSKAARERMASLLAESELWASSGSPRSKSGSPNSPTVSNQVDLARVHRLLDDTENRYESFVRHQSDSHQKLLSDVLTHAQRDNEEWKRILGAQNAGEREYLELMLHKAESRIQRIEEQYKKEREQLELRFHAQEDRCLRLAEFCIVGLSVSTVDGRILDCNDAFARILGFSSAEEVMARPDDGALRELVLYETPNGMLRAPGETRRVERCVRRQDGQRIWLSESVALISRGMETDPVVERVVIDASERHRLYGEIRRARRIEAVAQLAGAAVQEFRNILNSTMEYSSFALQTLDEQDPRRARAEQIREMVNRAGSLAQQLSDVIQGRGPEPAGFDANEALSEMTSVLGLLAGDDVSLQIKPAVGIGPVAIERSKFEQILTALVVAARDCLPAGGTVFIELSAGEVDSATAPYPCLLLTVCSVGYDVLPPQRTSTLDHLVASCQAHLQTGGKSGNDASYRLLLPLSA